MQCSNTGCRRSYRVADAAAGKKVRCPGCKQIVQVPLLAAQEAPPPPPRSRPRPPLLGRIVSILCWLVLSAATVACFAFLAYTLYRETELDRQIADDPEVKLAREEWWLHHKPGGTTRYFDTRDRARRKLSPAPETVREHASTAMAAGAGGVLLSAVAFLVMLCLNGVRFVCRFFVLCCVATLLAGLGMASGASLAILSKDNQQDSPEVEQMRILQRQADARGDRVASYRLGEDIRQRTSQFNNTKWLIGILTLGGAVVVLAVATLAMPFCTSVLVYKLWARVQDGQARTTPGMALLGLFIPLFNFYWAFVALPGVARELNRCADKRGLGVERASPDLMNAYCILCLVAAVPFLGILAVVINLFVAISAFRGATRVAVALENAA